jgi:hypothetical protein
MAQPFAAIKHNAKRFAAIEHKHKKATTTSIIAWLWWLLPA